MASSLPGLEFPLTGLGTPSPFISQSSWGPASSRKSPPSLGEQQQLPATPFVLVVDDGN